MVVMSGLISKNPEEMGFELWARYDILPVPFCILARWQYVNRKTG
jgi:hypothetical protein